MLLPLIVIRTQVIKSIGGKSQTFAESATREKPCVHGNHGFPDREILHQKAIFDVVATGMDEPCSWPMTFLCVGEDVMIGTRELGDIKKTLREKFRKDKKRVQGWVKTKRTGLEASDSQNRSVLEELMWVEKLLREAIKEGKARPKRTRKRTKKEPAA